jgi:hypothetical protein
MLTYAAADSRSEIPHDLFPLPSSRSAVLPISAQILAAPVKGLVPGGEGRQKPRSFSAADDQERLADP